MLNRNNLRGLNDCYVEVFSTKQAVEYFLKDNRTLILSAGMLNLFTKCLENMKADAIIELHFDEYNEPFYLIKK